MDRKKIANFKLPILTGNCLGVYSRVMLNKTEGKDNGKNEKRNILCNSSSSYSIVSHKTTRKGLYEINRDSARLIENIGPEIEQSDWFFLVFGRSVLRHSTG